MFWKKRKLIADVVEDRCCNCGACIGICRRRALVIAEVQGKTCIFVGDPSRCTGCRKCMQICPNRAIEMIERYG
ncbi:MAG: 4Fe-4S binding protein [Dysgonamonadaceae bacterium]|nr:4Fe-4S binding protein [Dysgonamonadaceae bacterium]